MSKDASTPPFGVADGGAQIPLPAGLYARAAMAAPWMMVFFRTPDLSCLTCNATALKWLNPSDGVLPLDCRFQDLIGVEMTDVFKNQILPRVKVFGSWSGNLVLRDVWGSEFNTQAVIVSESVRGGGEEYLCLQACKGKEEVSASWSGYAGDRELLHAVLSSFPQSVFFKDLQGRYLRVSSFMASCFGREEANDMVGLTDFDLLPIDYARQSFEVEQHIIKTREPVRNKEQQVTYPNGQFAWISVSKFPLCDRDGNLVGTFGVALDITARKKEEEQRREMELQMQLSQKLESIGRLASGVAHEINTPAQFITDNTQFLQKAVTPLLATLVEYRNLRDAIRSGHAVQEALDKVDAQEAGSRLDFFAREIPATLHDTLEGLARVTKIVRSLKEFSHPNKTTKSLVDLNRAIETTLSLSRHEWKYVAEARTELQPDLPMIPCVFDEINQVILNLIVNAAHAIADERKSKQDVALGLITIRTRLDGPNALIEVSDTGTGIADDVKSHLFEPFFTTKEVGRGTGQGLAIIRTVIVKNHGGAIFFTTELGKGTTFTISLPLA